MDLSIATGYFTGGGKQMFPLAGVVISLDIEHFYFSLYHIK